MSIPSPSSNGGKNELQPTINLHDFKDLDSLDLLWREPLITHLQGNDSVKKVVSKTIAVIQKEFETRPEKINPHRVIILKNVHEKVKKLVFGRTTQKTFNSTTIDKIKNLSLIIDEILDLIQEPDRLQKQFYNISDPKKAYKIGMKYLDIQKTTGVAISLLNHWAIKFLDKAADLHISSKNLEAAIKIRVELSKLKLDPENPFNTINQALAKASVVTHPLLGECDFGVTLSGLDSQSIKRGTIHTRDITIEGTVRREFTFKASEEKCENIRKTIEMISYSPKIKEYLQNEGICATITCTEEDYSYRKKNPNTGEFEQDATNKFSSMGKCLRMKFGGLCEIHIGIDPEFGSMYNRVVVHMHPQTDSEDVQKLFALIGLSNITTSATDYDLLRYKLNALTHYFYPKIAARLEQDPNYFNMPLKNLKALLNKIDPEITKMHTRLLPNIVWEEIAPGERVLRLKNSSKELKEMGAKGFISGFSGSYKNAGKTVASVIQSGAFSSQVRFEQGLLLGGGSSEEDHKRNSADSIFTRLVTEQSLQKRISDCQFSGTYQLVFSLELSETMPYCYSSDQYGCRNRSDPIYGHEYAKRPSLHELVKQFQTKWEKNNEVMFKRRVDSKYIKGVTYTDPRNEILSVIEQADAFPTDLRTPEDKKAYISRNLDFVIGTLKGIEIKKIIGEITSDPTHWRVQNILQSLAANNLFPIEAITDDLQKEYLFQNLTNTNIIAEIETLYLEKDSYKGRSISEHWTNAPKQILITELQKLGYTDNVNGIPFDSFIMEKEMFDEEMLSRC